MWFGDAFASLVTALIFSTLLGAHYSRNAQAWQYPFPSRLFMLAILFLTTWAGGVWLRPFGPVILGAHWLPHVAVAIVVSLLLAAAIPTRPPHNHRGQTAEEVEQEMAAREELGAAFWVLVVGLCSVLIVYYVYL